jgi:Ni/Co efflux regulator RcnB
MKKSWVAGMLCGALLVSFSAVVAAQPQPQDQYQQDHHNDRNDHNDRNNHHDRNDNHRNDDRDHQRGMYERGHREGWYRKGGHMPPEYRGNTYVVTDWRARHLHHPPRGYHYVRSDNGDILLVAITTGIIASILAQH